MGFLDHFIRDHPGVVDSQVFRRACTGVADFALRRQADNGITKGSRWRWCATASPLSQIQPDAKKSITGPIDKKASIDTIVQ
jgi:hypothetical protein